MCEAVHMPSLQCPSPSPTHNDTVMECECMQCLHSGVWCLLLGV